ncbi:MAG: protein kinase [Gemmatimonadota bacterium]|nr:protein kinase [Gemmatimonadota bacterium]
MTTPAERLGTALSDRYRIERELGQGGMATVYLAEDIRHHRKVAVKVLKEDLSASVGATRFLREIEIAAQLQHPNILPLLDSGEVAGLLYYVMPYVDGQSLRQRLAREHELPIGEAVKILIEIVDALAHAHTRGVVHRDIKPDNVMLTGRHALVADFGVARAVSEATGANTLTSMGVALGTPTYMAPEQAVADPNIDHRADIYAVGVMGYELLAGRPPFSGTTPQQILAAQVTEKPDPVSKHRPGVSPALEQTIMRCLEKRPADRWQSAEELLGALEPLATPSGGTAPTAARMPAAAKPHRRTAFIAGGALVAAVLAAGAYALSRSSAPSMALGRSTQITSHPGLEIHPAISPDGKLVAYAAGNASRMRVFIRPVSGGRTIPLSDDSSSVESQPRWSPDGNQLLFLSRGGVSVAPALGGSARAVIEPGQRGVISADWSPDASSIAFVRGDSVFTVGHKGDAPRLIAVDHGINSCAWYNSNRWLACVRGNHQYAEVGNFFGNHAQSAIMLVSLTDGALSEITTPESLNAAPFWAPGGSLLYFVSDRDGPRDIYAVEIGSGGKPRTKPSRVTAGLEVQTLSLSANGGQLAYSVYSARANIWSIPIPAAGAVNSRAATPVTTGNQEIEGMHTSRDGRWLLYDSDVRGRSNIYRIPIGGGEPEQLTNEPFDVFAAELSPDGSAIAYHSFRTGKRQIEVKPLNGGPVERVTTWHVDLTRVSWSPDGRLLAFREWAPPYRAYVTHRIAAGRWAEPVYIGIARYLRWSQDQRFLLSTSVDPDGGSSQGIALIPADPRDSSARRVLYRAGPNDPGPESPESTPDGKSIIFKTHDAAGQAGFWSLPSSGGTPRQLIRFTDSDRQSNRVEFATDGKRIFFTIDEKQSDVHVAELVKR